MSKILNVIIDSNSNKYFVAYETGKSKMYLADKLPKTIIDYISSENAKISYTTKTAEQETTEAIEATAEEATASATLETEEATETTAEQAETAEAEQAETAEKAEEQRRKTETEEATTSDRVEHKIIKIRNNFYIACSVINNTVPKIVVEAITNRNRSFKKDNTVIDIYYRRTAEEAEQETATAEAEAIAEQAEAIRKNLTIANNAKHVIYNAKMKAETIAKQAEAEAKTATAEKIETLKKLTTKAEAEAIATAKEKSIVLATAETAVKRDYNNKSFEEVKERFYATYKQLKLLKATATASASAIATAEKDYAESIDSICMILVLSVLKKLASVSRTGKTHKTKHDTNYYTIYNIRNDLIVSHNALNKLSEAIEANSNSDSKIKYSTFEINKLFEASFASDGIELLATAKEALIAKIAEAEAHKINVDLNSNNFLDTIYKYTDLNKKVWRDIQTVTYIKAVTTTEASEEQKKQLAEQVRNKIKKSEQAEAVTAEAIAEKITTVYTVEYLSNKTKTFSNLDVPKTTIQFIEHETALKNNCYDKKKNLYLIQKETCIAKEVFSAVRSYIENEKTTTTNNSYCYIADVTTITDNNGTEHNFETYQQLQKENTALIYNIKSDFIAKSEEVNRLTDFIESCNFSNNYKIVFNEMLKNNGYRVIAKKHNMKEQTVKSETRAIRKKIIEKSTVGNKQKYLTLKKSVLDINNNIIKAKAKQAEATATAEQAEAIANKILKAVKQLKKQLKQKNSRSFRKYNIVVVNTATYKTKTVLSATASTSIVSATASVIASFKDNSVKNINDIITTVTATAEAEAKAIETAKSDLQIYKTDIINICENALQHNRKEIADYCENVINTEATAEAKEKIKNVIAVNKKTKTILNLSEATAEATAEVKNSNIIFTVIYTDNTVINYYSNNAITAEAFAVVINYLKYKTAKATVKTLKSENSLYRNTLLNFAKNETAITEIVTADKISYNDFSAIDRFTIAQNNFRTATTKRKKYIVKYVDKQQILNYRLKTNSIKTINNSYVINHSNTENINNIAVSYAENNSYYYNNNTYYYILNTADKNYIEEATAHINSISCVKYTVLDNSRNSDSNSFNTGNNTAYYKYNIANCFIIDSNSYCYKYNVINKFIATLTATASAVWIIIKPTVYKTITKTIDAKQQYYYDLNGNRKKHKNTIYNTVDVIETTAEIAEHGIFKKCIINSDNSNSYKNYNNLTILNKEFFDSLKTTAK